MNELMRKVSIKSVLILVTYIGNIFGAVTISKIGDDIKDSVTIFRKFAF